MADPADAWTEDDSETYRLLSEFAVPERERQVAVVSELVASATAEGDMLDLCCGEGLLSRALLDAVPGGNVLAYDGSPGMIERAKAACDGDPRLKTRLIRLADTEWRRFARPLRAVVSSLAVHHLDGTGKRRLFADILAALASGGVLVLADVIRPVTAVGNSLAARMWDEEVARRSLEIAGDLSGMTAFREADWNHFRHDRIDPIDRPSTVAEHLDWLREAGFVDVDIHWMMAGQVVLSAWRR